MADLPNWFDKRFLPVSAHGGKLEWLWAVDEAIAPEQAWTLRKFVGKELASMNTAPEPLSAEWVQAELDAGRDVDLSGPLHIQADATIRLRPGSGCLIGGGYIWSLADPVIYIANGYERIADLSVNIRREDLRK